MKMKPPRPLCSARNKTPIVITCIAVVVCYSIMRYAVTYIYKIPSGDISSFEHQFDIITELNHPLCEQLLRQPPSKSSPLFDKPRTNPNFWINFTDQNSCAKFKQISGQPMWSSEEEINYPLAFSIMAFEDRQQLARLMRIIHRPHNLYCIHVDAKSSLEFRDSVLDLAKCFGSNVLVVPPSQSTDVQWGYYSVLEPALTCAKMLVDHVDIRWNYLLNLNAKEFPILTNWELVRVIKALNGSNVAEAIDGSKYPTWVPKGRLNFKIRWVKGYFLAVLRRDFVIFMLTNDKALQILEVMQNEKRQMKHPDEFLFSTLVYNPDLGAPGACYEMHRLDYQDPRSTFVARYLRWDDEKGGCPSGRIRRHVCVFGVKDLHILSKRKEMFGNKFVYDFQPLALDCMEYWITKKLIRERKQKHVDPSLDEKFYSDLYCSKNHAP